MSSIGTTFLIAATQEYVQAHGGCDVKGCPNAPAVRLVIRIPSRTKPFVKDYDAIAYVMVAQGRPLGSRPLAACLDHVEKAKRDFGTPAYFLHVVTLLKLDGKDPAPPSACRIETEPLPSSN